MDVFTRRRFLIAAAAGAAARGLALPVAGPQGAPPPLPARTRATLRAAMDAIVPAADGMPAAGEAGVLGYLEGVAAREPDVKEQLRRAAAALDRRARPAPFASLKDAGRVRALEALEAKEPALFESLRDLVYEGYYTRPEVWKLLGFEFYGPDRPGPGAPEFDEEAVARVGALPPLYRKVT